MSDVLGIREDDVPHGTSTNIACSDSTSAKQERVDPLKLSSEPHSKLTSMVLVKLFQ